MKIGTSRWIIRLVMATLQLSVPLSTQTCKTWMMAVKWCQQVVLRLDSQIVVAPEEVVIQLLITANQDKEYLHHPLDSTHPLQDLDLPTITVKKKVKYQSNWQWVTTMRFKMLSMTTMWIYPIPNSSHQVAVFLIAKDLGRRVSETI